MKIKHSLLITLLLVVISLICVYCGAQTISTGPQTNWQSMITITNNTNPSLTNPTGAGLYQWGKFLSGVYVYPGPCILAGGIKAFSIASGGTNYAVNDTGTINGGTVQVQYKVISVLAGGGGVANVIGFVPPIFASPYGVGYSVANGVATTPTLGVGSGLKINITSIYAVSPGPNCMIALQKDLTASYANAAGQSITFTHGYHASAALDGTYITAYTGYIWHDFALKISNGGSGQTSSVYYLNISGGGGGSGMVSAAPVDSTGIVTKGPATLTYGAGYSSCPTATMPAAAVPAGAVAATFTCNSPEAIYPAWAMDTSLAAGTSGGGVPVGGNVSGGMIQGKDGTLWSVQAYNSYQTYSQDGAVGSIYIQTSTDGGATWGNSYPLLYDGFPGAFNNSPTTYTCGPPAPNSWPCYYVVGGLTFEPDGHTLVLGYWKGDPSAGVAQGGNFSPTVGGNCCFILTCDTLATDCHSISNWNSPYHIPITIYPALAPSGYPYAYTLDIHSSYDNSMPPGQMGIGICTSSALFCYIVVSCDGGATWGTGTGCPSGTLALQQVQDPSTPGFNGTLPTQEFDFGWIGGTTYFMVLRNTQRVYTNTKITSTSSSGGVATYTYTGSPSLIAGETTVLIHGTTNGSGVFNVVNQTVTSVNTATQTFTVNVPFGNFALQAEAGTLSNCIGTQISCGATVFGYSKDNGNTWHIAQSSLDPFLGRNGIINGKWDSGGMMTLNTQVGGYWTIWWIERDECNAGCTPANPVYLIASTIRPSDLVNNLASWTNANLQSLWLYLVNVQPSSPYPAMVQPGNKVAYFWNAGPAPDNATNHFWNSYGAYSFVSGAFIGIKGIGIKGTAIQ